MPRASMRIVVAAVAPRGRAQPWRRDLRAVLADVLAGRDHRALGRIGLGRYRQVDRRLRQSELSLRHADMLDGGGRGGRHRQRIRVGVADVLGGEHDHPADDEPRVLATLEHHRQVVKRGVRVRAACRLDPGRDRVVVAIGLPVVQQRASLERVLGVGKLDDRRRDPRSDTRARARSTPSGHRRLTATPGIRARLGRPARRAHTRHAPPPGRAGPARAPASAADSS